MLICQWKPAYTSVTTNNAKTVWTCFHSLQKLVFLFSLVFLRSYFSQKSVQVGFWTASRRRKNWLSEYHRVCYRWSGQWWGPCALWPRVLYPERLRTGADLQIRLEWRMGWSGGKKQIHESQGELLIRCFQVKICLNVCPRTLQCFRLLENSNTLRRNSFDLWRVRMCSVQR